MLSYEIIIHCICGEVLKYNLDANRFTLAVIGREDNTSYQHIPLCGDDNNLLSRTALYFAYDIDKKDWVLGNGFPIAKYHNLDKNNINKLDEETKNKRFDLIYAVKKDNLREMIHLQIEEKKNIKQKHKKPYFQFFTEVKEEKVFELSKLSGVGIYPVNYEDKDEIFFNKEKHKGIKHLLFQNIPFHWYIEINDNMTNREAVMKYIRETNYLSNIG